MLQKLGLSLKFSVLFSLITVHAQTQKKYISLEKALLSKKKDTIEFIEIKRKKLKSLPVQIYQFNNLKGLDVSRNRLKNLPDSISTFVHLEELNISRNKFEFIPISLTRLKSLKSLKATWNKLTLICDQMENLENVIEIDFFNNEISDFGNGLHKMKRLQRLDIRGVMYGIETHKQITKMFKNIQLKIDPPCSCLD